LSALFFGACFLPVTLAQAPPAAGSPAAGSGQDSANQLFVAVGKSVLVDSAHPIARIAVGLGEIAEATATSPTEVLVNGKSPGETSLILWDVAGGRQFFNINVGANNYATNDRMDALRRELRVELPGQALRVSSENGLVFLRGTVKDLGSADRAVQIASTAGKVVNLLYVDVPPTDPQIRLKVRFASVDRSLLLQLGLNVYSLGATNSIGSVTTQQFSPPTVSAPGGTTPPSATLSNLLNLSIFRPDLNLGATLQALQTQGLLQVLAEPNLIAANGKQASFLAGGEFPFPVIQGSSGGGGTAAVTIQFKEFGVRLNFIPTVTVRNTIRLQLASEVSALDFSNGLAIQGFTVPALTTRKVKTEVELGEGQSFAVSGLIDNRETKTFEKIPFIGDIPVLGKLFQSISKNRTNTELIVIVTPELVAPIPAGTPVPLPKYPDKFLPPNSGIPMENPGADVTGAKPLPPAFPSIPLEQLLRSQQPEQPLVVNDISAGAIYTSPGPGAGVGGGATPVPGQPPPQ
jgi:pilus assembly protein CpaC